MLLNDIHINQFKIVQSIRYQVQSETKKQNKQEITTSDSSQLLLQNYSLNNSKTKSFNHFLASKKDKKESVDVVIEDKEKGKLEELQKQDDVIVCFIILFLIVIFP